MVMVGNFVFFQESSNFYVTPYELSHTSKIIDSTGPLITLVCLMYYVQNVTENLDQSPGIIT